MTQIREAWVTDGCVFKHPTQNRGFKVHLENSQWCVSALNGKRVLRRFPTFVEARNFAVCRLAAPPAGITK